MSPASGLLAPTSCPYSLPLGFGEGHFCPCCPPPESEEPSGPRGRGCTALFQCLPRSLGCSALTWQPFQLLLSSPLGHFSNKGSWTNWNWLVYCMVCWRHLSLHLVSSSPISTNLKGQSHYKMFSSMSQCIHLRWAERERREGDGKPEASLLCLCWMRREKMRSHSFHTNGNQVMSCHIKGPVDFFF